MYLLPKAVSKAVLPATGNARAIKPLAIPVAFRAADRTRRASERIKSCSIAAADGKKRALARHRHLGSAPQSSTCSAGHGTTECKKNSVRG